MSRRTRNNKNRVGLKQQRAENKRSLPDMYVMAVALSGLDRPTQYTKLVAEHKTRDITTQSSQGIRTKYATYRRVS